MAGAIRVLMVEDSDDDAALVLLQLRQAGGRHRARFQ